MVSYLVILSTEILSNKIALDPTREGIIAYEFEDDASLFCGELTLLIMS